jgi:hypothetical protein
MRAGSGVRNTASEDQPHCQRRQAGLPAMQCRPRCDGSISWGTNGIAVPAAGIPAVHATCGCVQIGDTTSTVARPTVPATDFWLRPGHCCQQPVPIQVQLWAGMSANHFRTVRSDRASYNGTEVPVRTPATMPATGAVKQTATMEMQLPAMHATAASTPAMPPATGACLRPACVNLLQKGRVRSAR